MITAVVVLAIACGACGLALVRTRRELSRERRRRERDAQLALVGRAAAGFVHDLRNSVMVLQGFGSLARKAAEDPSTPARVTRLVTELADQSQRVADELAAYVRFVRGERDDDPRVALGRVASGALALAKPIAHARELAIDADLPDLPAPALPEIAARAALLNLLLNAIDHAAARVTVRAESHADAVLVHVEDDGPGVPPQLVPSLFEPFTAQAGGTGLGLANARDSARSWGGSLTYERVGALTRFTLRVPLCVRD